MYSPNAFVIITPNRVFNLQAVSPFEMHKWIGGMYTYTLLFVLSVMCCISSQHCLPRKSQSVMKEKSELLKAVNIKLL